MADPAPEQITFPQDIPWHLSAHGVLDYTPGPAPIGFPWLVPSLGIFTFVSPRNETVRDFPFSRIMAIKLAATLTGLDVMVEGSHINYSEFAPCIGAILSLRLSFPTRAGERQWPHVPPANLTKTGLYVRDVYPKHQEYVVNQILGQETLDRQSTRVSTTKTWNVSGNVSASIPLGTAMLGVSLTGGVSESRVSETSQEHQQRDSRQTEVHQIYHILTAYGMGGPDTTFTIQPRPFEGESWELIRQKRILEGLTECIALVNVPHGVKHVLIEASLMLGFRVTKRGWQSGAFVPDPPRPPLVADLQRYPLPFVPEAWQRWADAYRAFKSMEIFVSSLFDDVFVLGSTLETRGWTQVYWGSDPCGDEPPIDPCLSVEPPSDNRLSLLGTAGSTTGVKARFAEIAVPKRGAMETIRSNRDFVNAHMLDLFEAMRSASNVDPAQRVPLTSTRFWNNAVHSMGIGRP